MSESVDPLWSMADGYRLGPAAAAQWTTAKRRRRRRPATNHVVTAADATWKLWKIGESTLCWLMLVCCTINWCLVTVGASYLEAEDLINDLDRPSKYISNVCL